jgi:hypothetical protein
MGIRRFIGNRLVLEAGASEDAIGPFCASWKDSPSQIPNRVGRGYGISIDYGQRENGKRSFMLCEEVSSLRELPNNMESLVIPSATWVTFYIKNDDPEIIALVKKYLPDLIDVPDLYFLAIHCGYSQKWAEENGYQFADLPFGLEGSEDGYDKILSIPIMKI